MKSKVLAVLMSSFISTLAHAYNKTVDHVDINRFMGDWYVVAGRFTSLEKNVFNAVESYKWNAQANRIDIDFRFNKGSLTGPVKRLPQKAWILNRKTNAYWKVSPMWPLKFDYLVIGLGEDYEWTAIGVPNEAYLWVMVRDPQMPKEKIDAILDDLSRENYNTDNIVYVEHDKK